MFLHFLKKTLTLFEVFSYWMIFSNPKIGKKNETFDDIALYKRGKQLKKTLLPKEKH